jgi:hypothetical protein
VSAGEILKRFSPYRKLGAPVPQPSPEVLENLLEFYPDEYDTDMLQINKPRTGLIDYLTQVDALRLTQIAGRLGLTIADANSRLIKLVPLGLKLNYSVNDCPEEVVHWQDPLLLTIFLDGQHPSISGEVSLDHLQKVANETGDSVDWLVSRVRLYAPLFSLIPPREYTIV